MDDGNEVGWRGALARLVVGGAAFGIADATHVAVAGRLGLGVVGVAALVVASAGVAALLAGVLGLPAVVSARLRRAWPEVWVVAGAIAVAAVRLGVGLHAAGAAPAVSAGAAVGLGLGAVGLLVAVRQQRLATLAVAGVAALGLLGWGVSERHPVTVGHPSSVERPNLLLITVAGARADRYGAYPIDTPAFDRLVAEGTAFAVAIAPGGPPATAVRAVLAPAPPLPDPEGDAEPTDLAGWSAAHDYATAAFLGAAVDVDGVDDGPSVQAAFQVWDDDQAWPKGIGRTLPGLLATAVRGRPAATERRATDVVDRAVRFLDHTVGTWFVWVHLVDPEPPFTPPAPFDVRYEPPGGDLVGTPRTLGERAPIDPAHAGALDALVDPAGVVSRYDGEVASVDAQVARLLAAVEARGAAGRTLVAMVGTDGINLAASDVWFGHGTALSEGVLHVPAALRLPGRVPVGHVVRGPVQVSDIGSTLLDLLGADLPAGAVSLRPTIEGTGVARRRAVAVTADAAAVRLPGVLLSWSATGGYRAARTAEGGDATSWTAQALRDALVDLPPVDGRPAPTDADLRGMLDVLVPPAVGRADRTPDE